jgi:hypothetical protein
MPHKTWVVGEEMISTDFNPIIADQVVCAFSSAAARTAGWPSPPNGAMSYLQDSNSYWTFNGAAWVTLGPRGYVNALDNTTATNIPANASADLPGMLTTWTPLTGRHIKATFNVQFGLAMGTPSAVISADLTDAANTVIKSRASQIIASAAQNTNMTVTTQHVLTTTGVAVTLKGRATNYTPGATGVFAQAMSLIIEDLG